MESTAEGEAQRYFDHALTLKNTILFLRYNKELTQDQGPDIPNIGRYNVTTPFVGRPYLEATLCYGKDILSSHIQPLVRKVIRLETENEATMGTQIWMVLLHVSGV